MPAHTIHWGQVVLILNGSCCTAFWHVLVHYVGEIDPLITVSIAVLR